MALFSSFRISFTNVNDGTDKLDQCRPTEPSPDVRQYGGEFDIHCILQGQELEAFVRGPC